jgi:hypothetical protein
MVKKIVFILTEGDHDTAFIYRILKANGLETHHKIAIKDYPYPLNALITKSLMFTPIEELNMEKNARSRFLPSYIMKNGENIVCIYRSGSISNEKVRTDFIKSINDLNIQDPDSIQTLTAQVSVLFFFDADDEGIDSRIEQIIKKELKISFPKADNIDELVHKEIRLVEDVYVGGFIFTEADKTKGKLEDILIPLMKRENEDIFEKAEYFLDIHESTTLFNGKVKYKDEAKTVKQKINKKDYDYKKSLVGTVGQLQMSGKSNTVCISDADYLNDEKIKSDATCVDIYEFVSKALI